MSDDDIPELTAADFARMIPRDQAERIRKAVWKLRMLIVESEAANDRPDPIAHQSLAVLKRAAFRAPLLPPAPGGP